MIWVLVVPMILGGGILLLDRFTARAADKSPRLDPSMRFNYAIPPCFDDLRRLQQCGCRGLEGYGTP
jgi:hypothetical protein